MVLSMNRKVDIKSGVIAPVVSENIQNCLLISNKNDIFANHEIKEFKDASSVAETFGRDSKEHNFAKTYFASFTGSVKKPEKLLVGENYSLQALPSKITSSFFEEGESPYDKLKSLGSIENTPAICVSEKTTIPIIREESIEEIIAEEIKNIGTESFRGSTVLSPIFEISKEELFASLSSIGRDEENKGDFSITFKMKDNRELTATVSDINLSTAENLEQSIKFIENSINPKIVEKEELGENYQINIKIIDEEDNKFRVLLSTNNKGSDFNIINVFSTTPVSPSGIANILALSDGFNPEKTPGSDNDYGDFSISFKVGEDIKTATAENLNFLNLNTLDEQLDFLKTKINEAISAADGLGDSYKVNITKNINTVGDEITFIIQTQNSGSQYEITEVFSTAPQNRTVCDVLRFGEEYNNVFYPGSDREYGDLSIAFRINGETKICTAKNLDFTSFSDIEEQLDYLTIQVNNAIRNNEEVGSEYEVTFKWNSLDEGRHNLSVETNKFGSKYNIDFLYSTIPLEGEKVADIIRLSDNSNYYPTKQAGRDALSLSEILDEYVNKRNDWWTISITEFETNTANEIAKWVNEKNSVCRYVFIVHDNNSLASSTTANEDTFGYSIYTSGVKGTSVIYGDETHAGFVAGIAASIDYSKEEGSLTFSGKRQSGLTITADNDKMADCLESNYYNYYGSYSSYDPRYRCFETGVVSGDDGQNWLDSLYNKIWLTTSLQNAMFNLLLNKNRIPFNDDGYSLIATACTGPINQAISNGVISKGIKLDEFQISVITEILKKDISDNLYAYGYYLYIGDNLPESRLERIAKNYILFYCDGGSIQKIQFFANTLL